jgi:capsular exopolysaccharide synthesis family protein
MEQDQRLTPLPKTVDLKVVGEYSPGYPSLYDDASDEGRRSIQQYINIVYKRLPIILALTLIVTAAVAFYMYRLPSQYVGVTEMLIEPRKPAATAKDSININFGNDVNYYNTQLRLLQSPELMKKVVISLELYRDPNLFGSEQRGIGSTIRSIFSSDKSTAKKESSLPVITQAPDGTEQQATVTLTPDEEVRVNQYASMLGSGLRIDQQERTNLVTITVQSTNPVLSARVADKIAYTFQQEDGDRETLGARQAASDLNKSIEQLRDTIAAQEAQLIADMSTYNMPLQEKGQDLLASRLGSLSESWLKAMESRRQLETRYNAAVAANARGEGSSIPELTDSKIYQDAVRLSSERRLKLQDDIRGIEKQIQAAETEKSELLVKYTPEYPEVKKMDERIVSLKANKDRMDKEVTQIIDKEKKTVDKDAVGGALVSLRSQLESKRREESQSLAAYEQEAARANVQGQAQTRLTTAKREIETNRNLLDTYTQRQKEQELAIAAGRPDNIKIPSKAVVNDSPVGPQRNRNILVAFFMSLGAGIGLAFLLDYLDDSVKSSDDIGRHLGLPTLAMIPHYATGERRRLGLPAIAGVGNGNGNVTSTGLITLDERNSPMAEAYRHLRTSLLFSSAGRPPQSILITSSQPSEGKTTTAVNTAITLAQADADVVIIDCDLRRPRLHTYFDLENSQGLTNYLSGERNTENLIKTCKTLPRLKVITSGPIPPNPAELLSSQEMKNLIQFLRGKYKHIIIDSPPAISFTDAAILSTVVDGVILVAMAGKSSLHLMRRFKHRAGALGARIYGVVLNGLKSGSAEYDYYSGYYDYYGPSGADGDTPVMETVETVHSTKG